MTGPFRSDESAAVPRFAPTGTAPQRPKADPKKDVCPNCGEVANGCNYCRKTPAPVPQTKGERLVPEMGRSWETEGECPNCGGTGAVPAKPPFSQKQCLTCSGTGKEKA